MLPGRPSQTMLRTATLRAAHQLLDRPLILRDPIAVGLVPESSERAVLAALDEHRNQVALRLFFALRSRFAEDRLAEAAARGVRQYVIVGAGLDTFAWRQPDYAQNMKIFAVDHIATLAWTQVMFWERGLPKPANLTFVPADLEDRRLGESLSEFGFDLDVPSLCSVLGVTQYLSRQAIDALLGFASSLKLGSEIVFSFCPGGGWRCGAFAALLIKGVPRCLPTICEPPFRLSSPARNPRMSAAIRPTIRRSAT